MTIIGSKYTDKIRSVEEVVKDIETVTLERKEKELSTIIDIIDERTNFIKSRPGQLLCEIQFPEYLTIDDLVEVFGKKGYYLYGDKPAKRYAGFYEYLRIGTAPTLDLASLTEEQFIRIVKEKSKESDTNHVSIPSLNFSYFDKQKAKESLNKLECVDSACLIGPNVLVKFKIKSIPGECTI